MKTKIEVINIEQKTKWENKLLTVKKYDFYHTFSYSSSYSNLNVNPILYSFCQGEYSILFPLIIRRINFSNYYDVTSVYGYAGPICSHTNIPNEIILAFVESINYFFKKNNIVSAFCRLHPSFKNENLLAGIGEVISLSETVYIDLSLDPEIQKKQYRKGVKSDLSKLYKEGYSIYEDFDKEYINEFINIYTENMIRVGARPEYYFDDAYYNMLLKSQDIDSRLYFVVKNNIKIAACIFVFTESIIQYHLSGTRGDYLKNSPVRMLIDHVRNYGYKNGYKELHLGGGVGSSEDSLFKFKASFSDCRHQFKVWKLIVNSDIYNKLVLDYSPDPKSNYFPLYRTPKTNI